MKQFAELHPFLGELRAASRERPFCRFEQNYNFDSPYQFNFSVVTAQIAVSKCLTADAVIALDGHQPRARHGRLKVNNKLARGLMDQPFLVSGLVAIGMTAINLDAVFNGFAIHAWNDEQLEELQRDLEKFDFLRDYQRLMRGEPIGIMIPEIDRIKASRLQNTIDPKSGEPVKQSTASGWPDGWIDLWKTQMVDMDLNASEWVDVGSRRVLPDAMSDYQAQINRRLDSWTIYLPWNWLFRTSPNGPVFEALIKFARMQVWVDEARIACGLERYRLAHGVYPGSLDALVPACISEAAARHYDRPALPLSTSPRWHLLPLFRRLEPNR